MKRKSILFSLSFLIAVMFSGMTFGQNDWPDKYESLENVLFSDTIFYCHDLDTLRPIELGYDLPDGQVIKGVRLHPAYGEWSLYSMVDGSTSGDYSYDVTVKNGGAGNVFKMVDASIGGYIFRYKSKDEQCGLAKDQSVYIYVFLMPDMKNIISFDPLFFCPNPSASDTVINVANDFPYKDLYKKAKVEINFTPTEWTVVRKAITDSKVYEAEFSVTKSPKNYFPCNDKGKVTMDVLVDDIPKTLESKTFEGCLADTAVSGWFDRETNYFFKRPIYISPSGKKASYDPSTIGNDGWTKTPADAPTLWTKDFTFKWYDCDDKEHTVTDKIRLSPKPYDNNHDTVVNLCRVKWKGTKSIVEGILKDVFPREWGGTYWYERGDKKQSGGNIIPGVWTPAGNAGNVNLDEIHTGTKYYFKYVFGPSASSCFAGDSGFVAFLMQDPFIAADYRLQLCKSYASSIFDLAAFTGIKNATWKYVGASALIPDGDIKNDELTQAQVKLLIDVMGTHKFSYDAGSSCGSGATGVMYIKTGGKAYIPENITETYCRKNVPISLNLHEIVGYAGGGDNWVLKSAVVGSSGTSISSDTDPLLIALRAKLTSGNGNFDFDNDVRNILNTLSATTANPAELVFELKPGTSSCISGTRTLTIKITDNIKIN